MSLNCGLARRKGYLSLSQKERDVELCVVGRDAPIDRPVIRANPFIANGAGRDFTATHTLTDASKHVFLHENDNNFN